MVAGQEMTPRVATINTNCESHRFYFVEASYSQDYVVHEGNWKDHSAKMMEQMRSEARVSQSSLRGQVRVDALRGPAHGVLPGGLESARA